MASREYWKDKRVSRRQVLFAWAMVTLLAAGAQFVDMAYRGLMAGIGSDALAATLADGSRMAPGPRSQTLR